MVAKIKTQQKLRFNNKGVRAKYAHFKGAALLESTAKRVFGGAKRRMEAASLKLSGVSGERKGKYTKILEELKLPINPKNLRTLHRLVRSGWKVYINPDDSLALLLTCKNIIKSDESLKGITTKLIELMKAHKTSPYVFRECGNAIKSIEDIERVWKLSMESKEYGFYYDFLKVISKVSSLIKSFEDLRTVLETCLKFDKLGFGPSHYSFEQFLANVSTLEELKFWAEIYEIHPIYYADFVGHLVRKAGPIVGISRYHRDELKKIAKTVKHKRDAVAALRISAELAPSLDLKEIRKLIERTKDKVSPLVAIGFVKAVRKAIKKPSDMYNIGKELLKLNDIYSHYSFGLGAHMHDFFNPIDSIEKLRSFVKFLKEANNGVYLFSIPGKQKVVEGGRIFDPINNEAIYVHGVKKNRIIVNDVERYRYVADGENLKIYEIVNPVMVSGTGLDRLFFSMDSSLFEEVKKEVWRHPDVLGIGIFSSAVNRGIVTTSRDVITIREAIANIPKGVIKTGSLIRSQPFYSHLDNFLAENTKNSDEVKQSIGRILKIKEKITDAAVADDMIYDMVTVYLPSFHVKFEEIPLLVEQLTAIHDAAPKEQSELILRSLTNYKDMMKGDIKNIQEVGNQLIAVSNAANARGLDPEVTNELVSAMGKLHLEDTSDISRIGEEIVKYLERVEKKEEDFLNNYLPVIRGYMKNEETREMCLNFFKSRIIMTPKIYEYAKENKLSLSQLRGMKAEFLSSVDDPTYLAKKSDKEIEILLDLYSYDVLKVPRSRYEDFIKKAVSTMRKPPKTLGEELWEEKEIEITKIKIEANEKINRRIEALRNRLHSSFEMVSKKTKDEIIDAFIEQVDKQKLPEKERVDLSVGLYLAYAEATNPNLNVSSILSSSVSMGNFSSTLGNVLFDYLKNHGKNLIAEDKRIEALKPALVENIRDEEIGREVSQAGSFEELFNAVKKVRGKAKSNLMFMLYGPSIDRVFKEGQSLLSEIEKAKKASAEKEVFILNSRKSIRDMLSGFISSDCTAGDITFFEYFMGDGWNVKLMRKKDMEWKGNVYLFKLPKILLLDALQFPFAEGYDTKECWEKIIAYGKETAKGLNLKFAVSDFKSNYPNLKNSFDTHFKDKAKRIETAPKGMEKFSATMSAQRSHYIFE